MQTYKSPDTLRVNKIKKEDMMVKSEPVNSKEGNDYFKRTVSDARKEIMMLTSAKKEKENEIKNLTEEIANLKLTLTKVNDTFTTKQQTMNDNSKDAEIIKKDKEDINVKIIKAKQDKEYLQSRIESMLKDNEASLEHQNKIEQELKQLQEEVLQISIKQEEADTALLRKQAQYEQVIDSVICLLMID